MNSAKLTILLFTLALTAHSQVVTTLLDSDSIDIDDAIVLDAQGNLYGSHYMGTNVYKITPQGEVSIFATGFNTPNGLAFDGEGNLVVADHQGERLYKLSPTGEFLDTIPVGFPSGLLKDINSDTVFVTSYNQSRVLKLAPDGSLHEWLSGAPLNGVVGMCQDEMGRLYLGNFDDRRIHRWNGSSLEYIATVPAPTVSVNKWLGFICYANGSIWATSLNAHRVYEVFPSFQDSTRLVSGGDTAGHDDGPVAEARFEQPNGIFPSKTGDTIYVTEFSGGYVRMITGLAPDTVSTVSVPEVLDVRFEVYPNPVHDVLNINLLNFESSEMLTITASDGKVVYRSELRSASLQIDASAWSSGVYTGWLQSADKSENFRVVKD